jgi:transcriptional regulator with XRE-family HTH domain
MFLLYFQSKSREDNMSTKKQSSSKSSKKNEVISRKPDPKIRKFLLQFLQQNDLSQRRIAEITKASTSQINRYIQNHTRVRGWKKLESILLTTFDKYLDTGRYEEEEEEFEDIDLPSFSPESSGEEVNASHSDKENEESDSVSMEEEHSSKVTASQAIDCNWEKFSIAIALDQFY